MNKLHHTGNSFILKDTLALAFNPHVPWFLSPDSPVLGLAAFLMFVQFRAYLELVLMVMMRKDPPWAWMQCKQPSVEQTMIARGHLNITRNVLMEERSSPAWSPSPMQPECQVLTVNIPRGEQTHFDSSDNILENTLLIMHIAKQ